MGAREKAKITKVAILAADGGVFHVLACSGFDTFGVADGRRYGDIRESANSRPVYFT